MHKTSHLELDAESRNVLAILEYKNASQFSYSWWTVFGPKTEKNMIPNFYTLKLHEALFDSCKFDEPAFCVSLQTAEEKQTI